MPMSALMSVPVSALCIGVAIGQVVGANKCYCEFTGSSSAHKTRTFVEADNYE